MTVISHHHVSLHMTVLLRACTRSAITLGRIAWMCPEPLAPHLEHFTGPWCTALRTVRDDVEKEHAFLGLTALLRINPLVCCGPCSCESGSVSLVWSVCLVFPVLQMSVYRGLPA